MAARPGGFVYCSREDALIRAALQGDLHGLKGIMESLGGNGNRTALFSIQKGGLGLLHCAACAGHLEVCKYLVEELGGDANITGAEGMTPIMTAAMSGDVSTVKYLIDRGADLMKADEKGRTVLHHAACTGSTKVTEFLLSKGIPVDIDYGRGTALCLAASNEQDKTLKILLDHHANPNCSFYGISTPLMGALVCHSLKCMKLLIKAGADVNGNGSLAPPLVFATMQGGYTNEVRLLLKAGADPNIPDDLGRLPVELAALNDCIEEVEMLFPLTSPIPGVVNWSVDGIISHAKLEDGKPLEERHIARRKVMFKSQASEAFKRKEYDIASKLYGLKNQRMVSFHCRNLMMFDENEVNYNDASLLGHVVLLKSHSPYAYTKIDRMKIQSAIERQADVVLPLEQICQYLCDYVVITGSFEATIQILSKTALKIEDYHLAMMPLTPLYGSCEVSIDPTLPNQEIQSVAPQITKNYQRLKIFVTGLPLVFWTQHHLVPRIFRNICHVTEVCLRRSDLAFSMLTYARLSTIPTVAHVGIRRSGGSSLNIWPIWIRVEPAPAPPGDLQALQANETQIPRLCYSLYPPQNDGAGPSGTRGGFGAGYFLEAPVDSSNDGSTQTCEDMGTSSSVVPETPENEGSTEIISSPNSTCDLESSIEMMSVTSRLNTEC